MHRLRLGTEANPQPRIEPIPCSGALGHTADGPKGTPVQRDGEVTVGQGSAQDEVTIRVSTDHYQSTGRPGACDGIKLGAQGLLQELGNPHHRTRQHTGQRQ